jgi:DNA-binding response OmpR family regulator
MAMRCTSCGSTSNKNVAPGYLRGLIVLRILSLDDEPELVKLMGLILELAGYEYVGTDDNYTAWALLHAEPFDLLTQDLMRPDIDGWEFLGLLRSEPDLDRLPVIIVTTKTQNLDKLTKESTTNGYVTKPFSPIELLSQIARVLTSHGHKPPAPEAWQAARATLRQAESFEGRLSFLRDSGMRRHVLILLRHDQRTSSYLDQIMPALRSSMNDSDRDVRLAVAQALGALNHPDALDLLVRLWGDPDQGVRREALRAISTSGDARATGLLMDVLFSSDWRLRWMAALGLSRLQHWPAVEPLLQALHDPAPCLRMMAARALGAFDDAVNIIIWAGRSGNEGLLPRLRQIASTDTRQTHWGTLATLAQYTVNSIEAAAKRRDRQLT